MDCLVNTPNLNKCTQIAQDFTEKCYRLVILWFSAFVLLWWVWGCLPISWENTCNGIERERLCSRMWEGDPRLTVNVAAVVCWISRLPNTWTWSAPGSPHSGSMPCGRVATSRCLLPPPGGLYSYQCLGPTLHQLRSVLGTRPGSFLRSVWVVTSYRRVENHCLQKQDSR